MVNTTNNLTPEIALKELYAASRELPLKADVHEHFRKCLMIVGARLNELDTEEKKEGNDGKDSR